MNVFLLEYETRLKSWSDLRTTLKDQPLQTKVVEVDNFWQAAPIQTYYLHTDFIKDWPNPWQLLSDNIYCYHARALGIMYTLMLLGIKEVALCEATDHNSESVILVLVDNAKYQCNYWPNTVLNNSLQDFVITKTIDISPLYSKLG
jgi:hypothetical protein